MSLDKAYRLTADVKRVSDQIARVQAGDFKIVVGEAQLSEEYNEAVKQGLLTLLAVEGIIASNATLSAIADAAKEIERGFAGSNSPVPKVTVDASADPDAAYVLDDFEEGSPEQLAAVSEYIEKKTGGKVSGVKYLGDGNWEVDGDQKFYDGSLGGVEDSPFNQERDKSWSSPCEKYAKGGTYGKVGE